MPHLPIAGRVHPTGLAFLAGDSAVTFDYVEEISEPSYAPLIDRAEVLVLRTRPLSTATVARAARRLGTDAVDPAALDARGIALAVVGDVDSASVAEHVMMRLPACAERARDPARRGRRDRLEAQGIAGQRLLILGFGRIGRHLAPRRRPHRPSGRADGGGGGPQRARPPRRPARPGAPRQPGGPLGSVRPRLVGRDALA